jgi:hypothetical protein
MFLRRRKGFKRSWGKVATGKSLARVSSRRAVEMARYYELRRVYLALHPFCQIRAAGCQGRSRDVHHRAGRYGSLLCNVNFWMALCRSCHDFVHDNPAIARKFGYLLRRS